MGVIDTVKKGFGTATKNLTLVLALFAFNLVWNLASIPFTQAPGTAPSPQLTIIGIVISLIFILISIFVQGATLGLVKDHIKEGKLDLANITKYGMKYYVRLLGLGALIVGIIVVVAIVASLIVLITTPFKNAILTILASLVALIIGAVGLYYALLLIMSPYSIVCDETGIVESMKKSIGIVRSNVGKVLALLVVLILIALGIGFLVGFIVGLLSVVLPAVISQIIMGVINSAFNGYLGVVMTASFMMLYLALSGKGASAGEKVF